ncbi:MAG: hypothetical protein R3282_03730, partial [Rhodothermales bacterium]|nr:hypothetical protein [Rhodothermales bacterium]
MRSAHIPWTRVWEPLAVAQEDPLGRAVFVLAILASCVLPILGGCYAGPEDRNVVAQVGPEHISAEEFRLSYGLGFPHLTRGPASSRENYLQRMID